MIYLTLIYCTFFVTVLVATAANAEDLTVADPPSIPVEKIELSPPLVFPIRPIIEPVPDVVLIEAAAASARKIISGSINEALQLSRCPAYACTKEYNPVCGFSLCKGVRTFSNPCMLRAYNRCNYPGNNPTSR